MTLYLIPLVARSGDRPQHNGIVSGNFDLKLFCVGGGRSIIGRHILADLRRLSAPLTDHLFYFTVGHIIPFAKPDTLRFTDALPKTRSGKIMRRLLRDIAAGKDAAGDTTTLEDYTVLAKLRDED